MTEEQEQVIRELNEIRTALSRKRATIRKASALGLSQSAIAREIGLRQPSIHRWLALDREEGVAPRA